MQSLIPFTTPSVAQTPRKSLLFAPSEREFALARAISPHRTALHSFCRRAALRALSRLEVGELLLEDGQETLRFGNPHPDFPEPARARIESPAAYVGLCFGGSIGAAEGFAHAEWTSPDPALIARLFARNVATLERIDAGLGRLKQPLHQLLHALNRNTQRGSRRNIQAHYDLGNDFYSLFLDPSLSYSAAVFEHRAQPLHAASINKLERVCRKLELKPSDHLLEIGTGWGALALHAAERFGCRVTSLTLSQQQFRLATERVRRAGLSGQVRVLLQDYRALPRVSNGERFDKLVSIEMVEAVGHQYLGDYFATCAAALKPDGLMLLQAITIRDSRFAAHTRDVDFIKRYIFPGSCLPSLGALADAAGNRTDLKLIQLEDLTAHYALTLRKWRERFMENRAEVEAQGHSPEFIRLWEWYLAYCEGAFQERYIGNAQLLYEGPERRGSAPLAATAELGEGGLV